MIEFDEPDTIIPAYIAPERELVALSARYVELADLCERQQAEIVQLRSLLGITCTLILEVNQTLGNQDPAVVKAFQDTLSTLAALTS